MKNLLVLLFLVSCSYSPDSPEGLVKMFVKDTSSKSLGRDYYEKYTTGELLEAADELTDEDLENSKMANVKKAKTNILSKKCESDEKCVVTFIVEYDYQFKDKGLKSYENEVKKIAEIVKVEGNWKLSNVTNLKTFISAQDPIEAGGDIEN